MGESYTEAGTYHYSITEITGNNGGITYDTAERRFAVVVADADMDGDLEIVSVSNETGVTVTQSGNSYTVAANFNNVYQPTGSATVTIDVLKKMNGEYRLNGFQFALYNSADLADAEEIVRSTVTDTAGHARFTLTYAPNRATMEGEVHTYYLAELNTGNPNITYDTALYKVEVTVTDNGDGTITATPVVTAVSGGALENGDPTFTNTFVPSASAYVTLTANKLIEGDRALNANEFEFVIEAITAGAPLPSDTSVGNAANGAVVFDAIEFTAAGTYQYKIYESQVNPIGGFAYDGKFYEVTVTVTDREAKLYATVERVVKANATDAGTTIGADEIMSFTNAYDATDATVTLTGEKILTGKTMQANEFTFVLTPDDASYPMPASATVKNGADGKFAFGTITYARKGVYTYTLSEQATADTRYDFDKSVYTVTVTVTDNARGTLSAEVELAKNDLEATAVVFRNGFVPTPIPYDIYTAFGGEKVLAGRPLQAGEFEFALINAINGNQIGETVKNDTTGKFAFPELKLPEAGIYHFKITEIVGDEKGVSYDTAAYHIRVEVEQAEDGTLSIIDEKLYIATVTKEEVGGVLTEVTRYDNITGNGSIVFNNTYTADPTYVTLEATKILTGRDLVDGEFKFDLHATDDQFVYGEDTLVQDDVVLTLNDDGTGNVAFMPIVLDAEGTYHYVIVEDELDEKGIVADKTAYKVEVVVTDNHEGALTATVKVNGELVSGSTVGTIRFNNTYTVAATEIVIKGTKTLTGRDLAAEEFSFELYDKAGTKLETVKNAADGTFAFTAIPVTQAGEYVYTVRELQGNAENVTYDASVYTVTVTVTDRLDGTFDVEYAYAKGTEETTGVTFVNAYSVPTPNPDPTPEIPEVPDTGDSGDLRMWFALLFVGGGLLGTLLLFKKSAKSEEK